jgi:hypothetical protein
MHHPLLPNRRGTATPIHKVRIAVDAKPFPIGKDSNTRFVAAGAGTNHHTEIVAELDNAGNDRRWIEHLVTRREAYRRHAAQPRERVVKDRGPVGRLCLFAGDYLEWTDDDGVRRVYRIVSLSPGDIECRQPSDGRTIAEIQKAKARIRIRNVDVLRTREARKVAVTPLGKVLPCND